MSPGGSCSRGTRPPEPLSPRWLPPGRRECHRAVPAVEIEPLGWGVLPVQGRWSRTPSVSRPARRPEVPFLAVVPSPGSGLHVPSCFLGACPAVTRHSRAGSLVNPPGDFSLRASQGHLGLGDGAGVRPLTRQLPPRPLTWRGPSGGPPHRPSVSGVFWAPGVLLS